MPECKKTDKNDKRPDESIVKKHQKNTKIEQTQQQKTQTQTKTKKKDERLSYRPIKEKKNQYKSMKKD
jgi:hypothetical protein